MDQTYSQPSRGSSIVIAFGTAAAMWAVAWVAMVPGLAVLPWTVMCALAICLLGGGWAAGALTGAGPRRGLLIGGLVTVINLLILGSLFDADTSGGSLQAAGIWLAGSLVIAVVLVPVGTLLGRRGDDAPSATAWTGRMAIIAALIAFILLVAGGIVTGLDAGLAVRGWLTANDYPLVLFPLHLMQSDEGVYAEHTHRLWGLLVGLSAIVLTGLLYAFDSRRWLWKFAALALLAIIVQGVMGGLRVTEKSVVLAIVHGIFGQVVFATLAAIALVCSIGWSRRGAVLPGDLARRIGGAGRLLVILLLVQLTLGAVYRHLNGLPDAPTGAMHGTLGMHILMAMAVAVFAVIAGGRVWAVREHARRVARLGHVLWSLVGLQLVLGIGAAFLVLTRDPEAPIPLTEVFVTSAHHGVGALLLATAVMVWLWGWTTGPERT